MKKYLLSVLCLFVSVSVGATIIQGELVGSPGTYNAYAIDSSNRLLTVAALDPAASTAALQTTGNTSLSSIDTKIPALVSGSVPVTGAVSITGTPAVTATISGTPAVSISGTVTTNSTTISYTYKNITGNATTVIKSGAGILKRITFNTPGTLSQMVVYDNSSGSGNKIGTINTTLGQATLDYDVSFSTGLTIVTTGTLAADVTVVYN
jgi:hypothetical protein